jgi:hypothetical protein
MSVPRRLRSVSDWEYELRASSAAVLELERLLGKATEVAARAGMVAEAFLLVPITILLTLRCRLGKWVLAHVIADLEDDTV